MKDKKENTVSIRIYESSHTVLKRELRKREDAEDLKPRESRQEISFADLVREALERRELTSESSDTTVATTEGEFIRVPRHIHKLMVALAAELGDPEASERFTEMMKAAQQLFEAEKAKSSDTISTKQPAKKSNVHQLRGHKPS